MAYAPVGTGAGDSALCCCEYANAQGEVVHMLQLCCECGAFDELANTALSGAPSEARADAFNRALSDVDARIRFAWPFGGGAAHIGLAGLAPPVFMLLAARAAAGSFAGLVASALFLPATAAVAHRRLQRLRRRNGFLFSWTLHAYVFCGLHWFFVTAPRATEFENICLGLLGVVAIAALGGAHAPPLILDFDASPERQRLMRAHRCGATGEIVTRLDHYCAWVDSPIGLGNHRAYLIFVAATVGASVINCGLATADALARCSLVHGGNLNARASLPACLQYHAQSGRGSLEFAVGAFMAATALAVNALFISQCSLVSRNLSTYEARHAQRVDYLREGNPFDLGWKANWAEFARGGSGGDGNAARSAAPAALYPAVDTRTNEWDLHREPEDRLGDVESGLILASRASKIL
ncbi:hypothetical protein T492DRAFT_1058778 [Pavlovales sp. CCMP2436]|nr:hypothetical protein T492DRAFT_1058778 [Pavlovales sp. CCMP2436]|mmetsp:Transcript_38031/g.89399  ORF Transcript_38031/g.89399 Transcript_38031/m.89399 type:complete len:410 (+) Transcript_38031:97-1326(+)